MWKNRLLYLLLCVGMGYFCILYNERATLLIFLVLVLFPFLSALLLYPCVQAVSIELITDPAIVRRQEECSIIIRIRNKSILPISKLEFKVLYQNSIYGVQEQKTIALSFMGKSIQEAELHLVPVNVGNVLIQLDQIIVWDYSRCTKMRKKTEIRNDIMVLPQENVLDETLEAGSNRLFENESILLPKPGSDLTEILNIREYTQGDRISRIHWKLSSKYDELMIKEYASPLYYYPLFLLDLRRKEGEMAIDYMEAFFETFLSMAVWHIEHAKPMEAAYFDPEADMLRKQVITTREELYTVMHDIYGQSYQDTVSQSLRNFYAANELHRYSNVIYYTAQLEGDMEVLEKLKPFTICFTQQEQETMDTDMLTSQLGYGNLAMVDIQKIESGITKAAHKYLKGSRGEEYEG